jgi:hypothetical protein
MKRSRTPGSRPGFHRILLVLITLTTGPTGSLCADDPDGIAGMKGPWAEVRTFDVAPVQRPIALLAPNAQTPPPPVALAPGQRRQIMAGLEGGEAAEPGSESGQPAESFVLSASLTVYEDRGVLTLVQPYTVHPETGVHMRGSDPGSVGVKIRVEKGGRYLLDFLVRSAVPGRYELQTEGGSQVIEDASGDLEHVLLALHAGSSGWTTVRLRRGESDYFLYAVEITRFD